MTNEAMHSPSSPSHHEAKLVEAARADARVPTMPANTLSGTLPTHIGAYKITGLLGEGGMGAVYRAQQETPRREVAIKVIRGGCFVDDQQLRRFEREAQALAMLKHPAIAGIYESGCTDDGRHFFAMELIQGERLSDYARNAQLTLSQRLILFQQICDAINYAHQRGVMHRDLKPSNILVDKEGNPRILDFGLAKITDSDLGSTTITSEVGKVRGTLPYMSPEQARGNPLHIDQRSDIYSLGIILYQLLTDELPYNANKAMIHEAVRVICEEPPRRPSTIRSTLRGDLETIALKALEKEPDRRYQSASALAADIERFRTDQPILARPPSAVYELRKLIHRHRTAAVFVSLLFAFAIGFGAWMSILYSRVATAGQELQTRAEELAAVTNVQASILAGIDMNRMGRDMTQRQLDSIRQYLSDTETSPEVIVQTISALEAADHQLNHADLAREVIAHNILAGKIEQIESHYAQQPHIRTTVQEALSDTCQAMGLYDFALDLQKSALQTLRAENGNDDPDTVTAISKLGTLLYRMRRYAEAEPFQREALALKRRVFGPTHPSTISTIANLGTLLQDMDGRMLEAEPLLRESLQLSKAAFGDNHEDTYSSMISLASFCAKTDKLDEAASLMTRAVNGLTDLLGPDHNTTVTAMSIAGIVHQERGDFATAEPLYRKVLDWRRTTLGNNHPLTVNAMYNLGRLLRLIGGADNLTESSQHCHDAVSFGRIALGNHWQVGEFLRSYAETLMQLDQLDASETALLEAEKLLSDSSQTPQVYRLRSANSLIRLYSTREQASPGNGYQLKADMWQQHRDDLTANNTP